MRGDYSASKRRCGAMALIVTAVIGASPILAATDTQTGTNGPDGADGTIINNGGLLEVTDGSPGGAGGGIGATAYSPDVTNTATSTGGNGGHGGNGKSSGPLSSKGAAGGNGGGASSTAGQSAPAGGNPMDTATATGGNGGNGGNGGAIRFGPTAPGGNGGAGGNASVSSIASGNSTSGLAYEQAVAKAFGGTGGAGGNAGGNGGNGGLASMGTVSAVASGKVSTQAVGIVVGGAGGAAGSGGTGGNGASESLNNAITISPPGHMPGTSGSSLFQEVVGGDSGGANFGTAGLAGSGYSVLNYTFTNAPILDSETFSFGGNGGDSRGANGSAGGDAYASSTLHSDYPVFVNAGANYTLLPAGGVIPAARGNGSNVLSGTGNAGNGGAGSAFTGAYSTAGAGNARVSATSNSYAGNGGSVLNTAIGSGGAGGSATAGAISSNSTNDTAFSIASSHGGSGGQAQGAGFIGGAGGTATLSTMSATSSSGGISINGSALGGNGGSGLNGASAGNGGNASLFSVTNGTTSGDATVAQTATGGDAGGSDGGAPAVGGNATSSLTRSFAVSSTLNVSVGAFGGGAASSQNTNGSTAGDANATMNISSPGAITASVQANQEPASGVDGAGGDVNAGSGNGGAGSDAIGAAAVHGTGAGKVNTVVRAYGGPGGQGQGSGFSGGAGGTASIGNSNVSAASGDAELTVYATGGDGGSGINGAAGGNGAPVALDTVVSGTASGTLSLYQSATGGAGGSSVGAAPGDGGIASSHFTLNRTGGSTMGISLQARSGKGGDAQNTNAANGADADTIANLSSDHAVTASGQAVGGSGGNITGGLAGYSAGAGGTGVASSNAGGTGTPVGQSSVGAGATADGGAGGSVLNGTFGFGGNGGNAVANSSATGSGLDTIEADSYAIAGMGGQGSGNGFASGNGGNASGIATAFSSNSPATASVQVSGGLSQPPVNSASVGTIGSANGTATATGLNQAGAYTGASEGSSGLATAIAKANSTGLFSYLQSNANAPVDRGGIASSQAAVNQAAQAFPVGPYYHSDAALVGTPLSSDVTSRWTSDLNVKNAFNNDPAAVNAIGMTDLRYPTAGSGAAHTYSSVLELNEDNAHLNSDGLVLGMLAAQLDGNGAGLVSGDSLRFRLQRNGSTLVDQTFTTNPQVLSYFQNTVFNLGPQNAGLDGSNLDLKFLFDLTGSHPNAGIGAQFLLGTQAGAQAGVWNNASGGSWAIPTNWSANTMPIGPGTSATFGNVITSARTVALDENTTIGSIQFNNPLSAYTISPGAGAYSLNLDNGLSQSVITVINGHHTISAPINIAAPGVRITVPGAQNLALSGGISGSGGITKFGDGSTSVGPMAVNGLDMQAGRIQFTPGSSAPARTIGSLAISPGAILDVADGKLITTSPAGTWNGSTYTDVAGLVQSGRATGNGIISSAILAGEKLHAIGVAKAGEIKSIPDSETSTFAGQTVHGSDTIVMYTYGGDANLDGKINIDDYGLIDSHVGQSGMVFGWHNGDFNYDGKINIDDYGIIDGNIGAQGAPISTIAQPLAGLTQLDAVTPVPEPAVLGPLASVLPFLLPRRRRVS
jgi:hypothetical protein